MNPMSPPQIMASILAGLIIFAIHALAGLAVNFSLLITLFFSILTPLPLALISFRLGTAASLLTLFTATAAMMATSTPLYAVTYNIFFLLPSFCGCWLLGLLETSNTENSCNEETNNWFPLNSTLSLLGAFVSFLSFLLVVFLHKHPTFQEITHVISTQVTENIKVLQQQNIVDATKADKMIPDLVVGSLFVLPAVQSVSQSVVWSFFCSPVIPGLVYYCQSESERNYISISRYCAVLLRGMGTTWKPWPGLLQSSSMKTVVLIRRVPIEA